MIKENKEENKIRMKPRYWSRKEERFKKKTTTIKKERKQALAQESDQEKTCDTGHPWRHAGLAEMGTLTTTGGVVQGVH